MSFRSPSVGSRSQSDKPVDYYERRINSYKREIEALRKQNQELQNRLTSNESPDSALIQTCADYQSESQKLNQEIKNLQKRNIELTTRIANDSTLECLEQNKKLNAALQAANQREETLIEKYKRSSSKFKELRAQFESTASKYKELIQEKKESDLKQIELLKENQNYQRSVQELETNLQKHKKSLQKVMKHYLEAKQKKEEAERKLNEVSEQSVKSSQKVEERQNTIEQQKETIFAKEQEIKKLLQEIEQNKSDFQDYQKTIQDFEKERQNFEAIENELIESRENNDHLVTQLKSMESENIKFGQDIVELNESLNSYKSRLQEANTKHDKLKGKNQSLQQEIDQLDAYKAQLEEDQHRLKLELDALVEEKNVLVLKNEKFEEEIGELNDQIEDQRSEYDELLKENKRLKPFESDCAEYLKQIEALQIEKDELQSNLLDLNDVNISLNKTVETLKSKLDGLKIHNQELILDNERIRNENNKLNEDIDNISRENEYFKQENQKKDEMVEKTLLELNHLKEAETEREEEKALLIQTMNNKIDEFKEQNNNLKELLSRSQRQVSENREMSDKISKDYDHLSKQYVKLLQLKQLGEGNDQNSFLNHSLDMGSIRKVKRSNQRQSHSAQATPELKKERRSRLQNQSISINSPSMIDSPYGSPLRNAEMSELRHQIEALQVENENLKTQVETFKNESKIVELEGEDEISRYDILIDSLNKSLQDNEQLRDELEKIKSQSLHSILNDDDSSLLTSTTNTDVINESGNVSSAIEDVSHSNENNQNELDEQNSNDHDGFDEPISSENNLINNDDSDENDDVTIKENLNLSNSQKIAELQKKVDELNHQLLSSPNRDSFEQIEREKKELMEENTELKERNHALQIQLKGDQEPLLSNQHSHMDYDAEDSDLTESDNHLIKKKPQSFDAEDADLPSDDDFSDLPRITSPFSKTSQIPIHILRKTPPSSPNRKNNTSFGQTAPIQSPTRTTQNDSVQKVSPKRTGNDEPTRKSFEEQTETVSPIRKIFEEISNRNLSPGKQVTIAKGRTNDKVLFDEVDLSEKEYSNLNEEKEEEEEEDSSSNIDQELLKKAMYQNPILQSSDDNADELEVGSGSIEEEEEQHLIEDEEGDQEFLEIEKHALEEIDEEENEGTDSETITFKNSIEFLAQNMNNPSLPKDIFGVVPELEVKEIGLQEIVIEDDEVPSTSSSMINLLAEHEEEEAYQENHNDGSEDGELLDQRPSRSLYDQLIDDSEEDMEKVNSVLDDK